MNTGTQGVDNDQDQASTHNLPASHPAQHPQARAAAGRSMQKARSALIWIPQPLSKADGARNDLLTPVAVTLLILIYIRQKIQGIICLIGENLSELKQATTKKGAATPMFDLGEIRQAYEQG